MNKCYLCGGKTSQHYQFVNKKEEKHSINKCLECGFLRTFPVPDKDKLKVIYGKEFKFDAKRQSEVFRSNILEKLKENFIVRPLLNNLINKFEGSCKPKLLDIGCSTGWITSIAKDVGFDVKGLEANPNSAAIGREKFGIDVYEGFVEDLDLESKFDAVIMFHVLEHFVDPLNILEKVKDILNKNGKLLIVVPNAESFGTKIFKENYNWNIKHHTSFFSKSSLESVLQKSGFSVVESKTLISTPMLINSLNRVMRKRKRERKLSFRIKRNIFGNLFMFPLALFGKIFGHGEVLAVYTEKE